MRLLYSFRFQRIGDTWLASAVGQNAHLFQGILQLNEEGYFILSQLAGLPDLPEQQIIIRLAECLTNEYAVDLSTAQSSVRQVLDYLKSEGVVTP